MRPGVIFTIIDEIICTFLDIVEFSLYLSDFNAVIQASWFLRKTLEFIPIKPLAAKGSGALGNYAGHSRVPSRHRGPRPSTDGSGL